VLSGLEAAGVEADVTLFSSDRYFDFDPPDHPGSMDLARFYAGLYADIKAQAVNYPPRKTFFGDPVPCYSVGDEARFFQIDMFGGQTNIWGGTALPLTEAEFEGWPITRKELEPHYQAIADRIGIAGRRDRLSEFLRLDYSDRPPVKQLKGFEFLERHLNQRAEAGGYHLHAGVPPSAVDTRSDSPNGCIQCGECMAGCVRDSIYSARSTLRRAIAAGTVDFVGQNVTSIRSRESRPEVRCENGDTRSFDRVFLCAGCVATTEILMRSLEMRTGPILQDNCIYQFPIVNLSEHSDPRKEEYFGLTNLLLLMEPKLPELSLVQIQFYPNVDYLWRTLFPRWCWGLLRHPVRWLRDRTIWARAYTDAGDSYRYSMRLDDDRLVFSEAATPDATNVVRWRGSLRQALRGSKCYVFPFQPVLAHTSAHLAGSFPYGGGPVTVARDGEVMPSVHIADSSCFPKSPVIAPTMTIMANARRTLLEALGR